MSNINLVNLEQLTLLADPVWEKDLAKLGVISNSVVAEELSAEIKRQSDALRQNTVAGAARLIVDLGQEKIRQDHEMVLEIRRLKNQIASIKTQLQRRNEAWEYGSATLNYLPFLKVSGMVTMKMLSMVQDNRLWDISTSVKK